jgi:phage terminase small subunit
MNAKQERFCREYMIDLNATQAAIRAGYSKKTARQAGAENMTKPVISARISELKAKITEGLAIDAGEILAKVSAIMRFTISDIAEWDGKEFRFKPMEQWPEGVETAIASVKVATTGTGKNSITTLSLRFESKLAAAKLLGEYLGMFTGYDQLVRMAELYGKKLVDVEGSIDE